MPTINFKDLDLSEVDKKDDLLAPPLDNKKETKKQDIEKTQEIKVVNDNE